mmetsp:Transcript_79096/g.115889  ORF Transcript_79096/g.115889 Transcript_79096/m.115889 type:complete len:221 (-) Transcript_79096:1033-1695(-)
MLLYKRMVFGLNLLLELLDLVVHNFELAAHLVYFVLRLNQIFAVQIAVGPHCLVQGLLLFQLLLALLNGLLQIHDSHLADLDLFKRLEVLGSRVRRLLSVFFALLLERINHLALLLRLCLVAHNLRLKVLFCVFLHLDKIGLLLCCSLRLAQVVLQKVLLARHVLDIFFVQFHLPPLRLHLALKPSYFGFQNIALTLCLNSLLLNILDLFHKLLLEARLL